MPNIQPVINDVTGRRKFACSAAAVLMFIVNEAEEILMLRHPRRTGWEVVNGALNAEETLIEGALREIREEVGEAVQVRPLGTIHAYTFRYDDDVQYMISICFLMAYKGGEIRPGDDMQGSEFRWLGLSELMRDDFRLLVPRDQKWIMPRAIELFRLWKDQQVELQPGLDPAGKNKYQD